MSGEQRTDTMGRPPRQPDEEILRFIHEADGGFVLTREIRDRFDYDTDSGAFKRLEGLVQEGLLHVKEGDKEGSAKAYWLTEEGKRVVAGDE